MPASGDSTRVAAGSVVMRHHFERRALDLLGIALMIVRHAENDVGELDARCLDRKWVVAEVGCNAFPSPIEGFEYDLQRLGSVRCAADEFACFHC
jgi:hypothetical protein